VVQEESETSSNSNAGSISPIAEGIHGMENDANHGLNVAEIDANPVIEITPASGPGSMSPPSLGEDSGQQSLTDTPPKITSQNNQSINNNDISGNNWQQFQHQLSELCDSVELNSSTGEENGPIKTIPKSANSTISASLRKRGEKRLSDAVLGKFLPSLFGRNNNTCSCCCKHSVGNNGARTTCQSEPSSLDSMGLSQKEQSPHQHHFEIHSCAMGTLPMILGDSLQQLVSPWNTVDCNILVGTFEPNLNLRAPDVIDAIEKENEPILSSLVGVRILNQSGRLYVCLKSAQDVDSFLKGSQTKELKIRSNTAAIAFTPGIKNSIEITLSGLPADLGDANVISVLNQYGQIVAPLERSLYKGVDTCERTVQMNLIKRIPPLVSVAGYDVSAKMNCQDLSLVPSNNIDVDSSSSVSSANAMSLSPTCQNGDSTTHVGGVNMGNYNQSSVVDPCTRPVEPNKLTVTPQIHHKLVGRSTSSAPRLETDPVASMPIVTSNHRRQLSVGHGQGSNSNNNNSKKVNNSIATALTNSNHSSTTSLNNPSFVPISNVPVPVTKKPLTRLTRANHGGESGEAGGFKASFYKAIPHAFLRRNSSSASQHSTNTNLGFSRFLQNEPSGMDNNKELARSRNSSSEIKSTASKRHKQYGGKDGDLPWCGCWGNGLI